MEILELLPGVQDFHANLFFYFIKFCDSDRNFVLFS